MDGAVESAAGAYWSDRHGCWFVPVAGDFFDQQPMSVEPVRLELKDGELLITRLDGGS